LVKANPVPELHVNFTVDCPQNVSYNVNPLPVRFTCDLLVFYSVFNFSYSLDGQEQQVIENITIISETGLPINPTFYKASLNGSCDLYNLSEGTHNVTIYQTAYDRIIGSTTVGFTIDTTAPIVSVASTKSKVHSSEVSLNFTVNEQTAWVGYSLDGQDNITLTGNTTLTELSGGKHSIIVYATDQAGNTGSSKTIFSINGILEEFLTTEPVFVIVMLALIGASIIVYFVKFKKPTKQRLTP
jgi:hypothetical protein